MGRKKKPTLIDKLISVGAGGDLEALQDAFGYVRTLEETESSVVDDQIVYNEMNFNAAREYSRKIRNAAGEIATKHQDPEALELYKRTLLFDAPHSFDAYCRYLEWNRPEEKKFYEPRRKQLLPIVEALQELAEGKLELLAISCPPGIGKTTIAIFFLSWIEGKNPDLSVLGGSHSNSFLRGVYDEICRVVDPAGEYLYNDVFPKAPMVSTNAKDMRLDLKRKKRFESFEFSSVGSGNAGKVRASNLLYCDDLVDGIETAMSIERLDKLYQQYYTDLRQRKIGQCRELHIATRWSVHDVIGRLEEQYRDDPSARFLRFAAMNEKDESNFDYPYHLGFTTEFYRQQRAIMDDVSWRALYMNEPIEREGQLYSQDELQYYFGLPDTPPEAILAVCDIADGGGDYWTMPIVYQYGTQYYVVDILCDNGKPNLVESRIVEKLAAHKVQLARFESNRGGARVAETIQARLAEKGCLTKITTRWNQANKDTRIIMASGFVKQNFIFKDESLYLSDKEYRLAMQFLTGYTMAGKNKHDDVPDAMAMLTEFIASFASARITIRSRTF